MVTCSLKKAKSTLGRTTEAGCVEGLTGGRMGSTVEAAVVTTSFAGKSCLWPTAVSLAEGVAQVPGSRGVVVDDGASPGASQGKCFGSKGRSVFHINPATNLIRNSKDLVVSGGVPIVPGRGAIPCPAVVGWLRVGNHPIAIELGTGTKSATIGRAGGIREAP